LILKTEHLPRQARDKHQGKLKQLRFSYSGKAGGAASKLRSQTEKPSSKRGGGGGGGAGGGAGGKKGGGALTRSKSAVGSDLTGGGGSSPSATRKKAGGVKPTKATKKREKDVAKSVGGAREALQEARKLERANSKANMAAEAEKMGVGGESCYAILC
jgi:hypothetical protein